ncbi:MAG: methyltransferase [Chlorobi bacterium]|nr:methyltransferase [Chlorobiota bacterium]
MRTIDLRKYPQPRIRHHANPQVYIPLRQLRIVPPNYPPLIEKIDWQTVFANGRPPTVLDIGSGMGHFVIEYALAHPGENILGVDVRKPAVEWIANVLCGEHIGNAAVLWYSVANGLPFIESESLSTITYFFPDPWFKKRHVKRRAFTPALIKEIYRMLCTEGTLYLMTDVPDVDAYQRQLLSEHGGFDIIDVISEQQWFTEHTDQELFCVAKGIPYVRLRCPKRPSHV